MLDLHHPAPDDAGDDGRPALRLVPRGPRVSFRWIEDPRTPWPIRALAITLGVLLTTVGVGSILYTGALLKEYYDKVDAMDRAHAAARARQAVERQQVERLKASGGIVIALPKDAAPSKSPR
ncbi:MAG TPA: hypothetical protein VE404_03600 [Verrucomicrobiae bacterium]|nr:hypothetical protein [Verrucomicrobiae bacterium]